MNHFLIIGIIAGLCTALLNLSGYAGGVVGLGFILVLISPLPLMIASLGWGTFAGLVAVITSGLVLAIVIGPLAGLLFAVLNSLPAWWVTHLIGLSRAMKTEEGEDDVQWYPLERLLIWIAVIAILASMAMFVPFGFSLDAYRDTIATLMQQVYNAQQQSALENSGVNIDDLVTLISRLAPTASAVMIVISTAINLYLAGKIVAKSGRLNRPWPDLHQLTMPVTSVYVFLVALAGLLLLSGLPGVFSQIVASSLGSALMLVGLSVMHCLSQNTPARTALLWTTYILLVVFQWIGIILIILGVSEILVNVRSRFSTPPSGGGGPQDGPNQSGP
ncbi:Predicted membrane protein [Cohaesibacter sp. ES.047]|uniref:DUF2232 domain-containing protein n=1 Tax=Cohaesibacter sp. ES.047 TaxID=1798205 RepID=UPI000BB87C40|nr:DUF2232 domain-containing protein [Cohaesibacter sp. ES.047]SNY93842.1 Predicted membrane protein [Cohaesibacter sp. ES.047]